MCEFPLTQEDEIGVLVPDPRKNSLQTKGSVWKLCTCRIFVWVFLDKGYDKDTKSIHCSGMDPACSQSGLYRRQSGGVRLVPGTGEALAARILELGKQRGSAFALYRQGADAMQKGNTEEAADVGNAEACYRLAIWTAQQANGNLSEEEFKQVLSWLKQAAQQEYPEACYCMGALMEKNHPEVACKYYEIAANRQYIPAMLKLALLYDKEDTLFEQLFWMDRLVWNGEHSPLKDLPRIHMLYAEKLKKEAISDLQSEQQPETYKSRIEACREAILETGKAIFWQKCISRQPEKNDKEVNQMYEVQKELYVYLDSLEDLKHYAEKKKRIDAEIEKAEEEHAREAALYAQKKKEDALRNAEMMGVIFGAEMEAYLLARDFAEEIKEDPWLYCALTDVDPWLVNIL